MKIKITVSKVTRVPSAFSKTYATPVDMYLDVANAEFLPAGTLLQVVDKDTNTVYLTDFLFSSAVTALDAAPTTGQWVLT